MYIRIIILQVSVVLILICSNISWGGTKFDFRNIRWGMTKEEVKKRETLKLIKELKLEAADIQPCGFDKIISYYDEIAKTQIHYAFLNDRLTNVLKLFVDQYEDKALYIELYEIYKAILTNKYGATIDDEEIWLNDICNGEYVSALDAGDLVFHASWENSRSRIDLCLSKNHNADRVAFMIIYGGKSLNHDGERKSAYPEFK
ncbi:MAG: hypothetical protein HN402_04595 [Candidatus Scalindua sp.]|jgi:hypothetical protein|nr:hypothetical protein [Candidatus Scalindua sp.]